MEASRAAVREWTRAQSHRFRPLILPAIGAGLAGTATGIAQALVLARLLARVLEAHAPSAALLAGFVLLALLRAALAWAGERAAFEAGATARRRLRLEAADALLAAGPAILRTAHTGELAATLTDRIEAMDGYVGRWLPAATLAWAQPALVVLATLAADPWSAAILALAGLLVPIGMAVAGIGAAAASRRQFTALARLQARFLDRVRGIATLVLAGQAEAEARALAAAAAELRRRTMRILRVAFLSSAVLDCAQALALILLSARQAALLSYHRAGPAQALLLLLLAVEFFAPLRAFAAAYQDRLHASGAADALMALPRPASPPAEAEPAIRTIEARGLSVAFDDVTMVWDPARGPALDRLSFRVPAGELLVLAGPSGAGKSTVIELLLGFARPTSGRVLINGTDLATLTEAARSRLIAWIGQRPVLFAGTVRENIRFARPDASEEEVEQAARLARVADFSDLLPQGLDTPIGEGGFGLSGGQAQRVAIARAFLSRAQLLLLDEPTAHLDPATEAQVLESLRRLMVGRTVILASHSAAAHGFGGRRLDLAAGRAAAPPARRVAP